ncbi:hypothetical protein GCM10028827_42380 [Mucilaginibacter myungsuensis]
MSAQQFSHYNTGTLYDSFENPSQKIFIADSSRRFAFNLFVPNFNVDFTLAGNSQSALKTRAFIGYYDDSKITLGQNNFNYANASFNSYWFMLKVHRSLDGAKEWGVFARTKAEGHGQYPDESIAILNDDNQFGNVQSNFFNARYNYQVYHQLGLTYREDLDEQLSFGVKVGAILGVVANRVNIYRSVITYDRPNDQAFLSLAGTYRASFQPGNFTSHDLLPTFRNPGASISFGLGYLTEDKFKFQFNVKDLGFIRWNNQSAVGEFDNTGIIQDLSLPNLEARTARTALSIVQNNGVQRAYVSNTNSLAEGSVAKSFWIESITAKYTPTFIASKELFYKGFTGALVNHLQYRNIIGTVTASYSDMKYMNMGLQFMVKSPNVEFFIGSDRVGQTLGLAREAYQPKLGETFANNKYTGANFYLGFSLKFGNILEHPLNASYIPMGPKRSIFRKLRERITGKDYQ